MLARVDDSIVIDQVPKSLNFPIPAKALRRSCSGVAAQFPSSCWIVSKRSECVGQISHCLLRRKCRYLDSRFRRDLNGKASQVEANDRATRCHRFRADETPGFVEAGMHEHVTTSQIFEQFISRCFPPESYLFCDP